MKAMAFIRQPSFAKYIMADIAMAFRALGWEVQWMDPGGTLPAGGTRRPPCPGGPHSGDPPGGGRL